MDHCLNLPQVACSSMPFSTFQGMTACRFGSFPNFDLNVDFGSVIGRLGGIQYSQGMGSRFVEVKWIDAYFFRFSCIVNSGIPPREIYTSTIFSP